MAKKEKEDMKEEMTLEEARAWRASLASKSQRLLSEEEKREAFRVYWAENKSKYEGAKDIEQVIWVHLKASKMTDPATFEKGLEHFGLKKNS